MKINLIILSVALSMMFTAATAQPKENIAQIQNYSNTMGKKEISQIVPQETDLSPNDKKPIVTKSTKDGNVIKGPSSEVKNNEKETIKQNVLFKESFSDRALDNNWLDNSGTNNMMGFIDNINGKVLKISNKHPQISFIEYFLDDSFKGRNLKLECKIKVENIKQGEYKYEIGQLAIEYQVGEKLVYPAVQGLVYTKDWDTYYAREDGSTGIDDTGMGHFVFTIPENAKNIRLYLGLQNCTGTIYFKDLVIYEVLE